MALFGTSGIRGSATDLFTPEFCRLLGKTFVEFLKKHNSVTSIAVGCDTRESSPRIKKDLFVGLSEAGTELFDEGITPIPSINWLIKNTPVKAAVMITGSHIAPELNGLKFYAHDEEISYEDEKEIEEIYDKIKHTRIADKNISEIVDTRAADLYSEKLLGEVHGTYQKFKIAVDTANGAQSTVIPGVLKNLGFEAIEVNCNIESNFIARDTDTDDQAVIEDLKKVVVSQKCDLGIAFDGDGDRVVFINEKGDFIQGEYSCSLVARDLKLPKIVTTVSASQVVDKLGMQVFRTKVGSPYVIHKMKEEDVKFGFEPNGGAIFANSMYTRDGGTMMIRMLNIFNDFRGPFSKMFDDLPKFYMKRTKVEYKWEQKDKILSEAKSKFKGIKVEELDGLKIWIDQSTWILFRSSANAPEFRVFAESDVEEKAQKLLDNGMELVKEIVKR